MRQTKLFFSMLFVATMLMTSCEGEEDSGADITGGDCAGLESLAMTLNQKAEVFNSNPTSGNCSAMKTAALNLINVAKNCDGVTAEQYQTAAEAWANVDCSAFN